MKYWIFKVDPKEFKIELVLEDITNIIWWRVTRFKDEIKSGDIVFLWRTGTPHGICGVLQVVTSPGILPKEVNNRDYWYRPEEHINDPGMLVYAECRILQQTRFYDSKEIKRIPGLEHFSFFKAFQQATNFSITLHEGEILHEYIGKTGEVLNPKVGGGEISPTKVYSEKPAVQKSSTVVDLLQCVSCGHFVVSTDTARHIREVHAGQPVEWKKTK